MASQTVERIGGFVLAAGEGRRLRPVTLACPKALVPFCGEPLLDLAVAQLAAQGLTDIAVNCWHHANALAAAVHRLSAAQKLNLRLSREDPLLDTGGGLRAGLALLPDAEHLLVHNVDIILDFDLGLLIRQHLESKAAATLLLVPGRGPRTVDVHDDGRIADFGRPEGTGQYTFSGIHILRRDVLDLLPKDDVCSIKVAYGAALAAGLPVLGLPVPGNAYWTDLGTMHHYIRSHGEIADSALRHHPRLRAAQQEQARRRAALERLGVRCTGALGLGANLFVTPGAHLHNAVLLDNTRLVEPFLYADGVFLGNEVRMPVAGFETRRPDPRVYATLDLEPRNCTLTPLRKQGSGRMYCRLTTGQESFIWCAYSPARRENSGFSSLAEFCLRLGVRVPEIRLHLADSGEIVSRDLGTQDLQHARSLKTAETYLKQVVDQIARLHVLGDRAARLEELPLQSGFTRGLYDWERDYFREHLLQNVVQRPDLWSLAADEYCELRNSLLREPLVPIHRDLQSANIMIADEQTYLIDFQGMRLGCAAYDLGALLYDPYKCYPQALRQKLWRRYRKNVRDLGGIPPTDQVLYAAACQRLFQCLGAYGKLWLQDRLDWYRQFIVPGSRMLLAAVTESGRYPGIRNLMAQCLEIVRQGLREEE